MTTRLSESYHTNRLLLTAATSHLQGDRIEACKIITGKENIDYSQLVQKKEPMTQDSTV